MFSIIFYLVIGIGAGFLAGLLGIGGGVIIVPALAFLFAHVGMPSHSIMHMATSTSLATVIFTTGISVIAHHRREAVNWSIFRRIALILIIGTVVGTTLASALPSSTLRVLFALFVMLIAIHMLWPQSEKTVNMKSTSHFFLWSGGFLMGGMAGMLGVGGGIIAVPIFMRLGLSVVNAIATSSACALLISVVATLCFIFSGQHLVDLPPGSTGYVYWPAVLTIAVASLLFVPLGTKLAHRLPGPVLKRIFAVMLLLVGMKMLVG